MNISNIGRAYGNAFSELFFPDIIRNRIEVMRTEPYSLWHHAEILKENRLPEEANKALKLLEQISKNGKEGNPVLMIGALKKGYKNL